MVWSHTAQCGRITLMDNANERPFTKPNKDAGLRGLQILSAHTLPGKNFPYGQNFRPE